MKSLNESGRLVEKDKSSSRIGTLLKSKTAKAVTALAVVGSISGGVLATQSGDKTPKATAAAKAPNPPVPVNPEKTTTTTAPAGNGASIGKLCSTISQEVIAPILNWPAAIDPTDTQPPANTGICITTQGETDKLYAAVSFDPYDLGDAEWGGPTKVAPELQVSVIDNAHFKGDEYSVLQKNLADQSSSITGLGDEALFVPSYEQGPNNQTTNDELEVIKSGPYLVQVGTVQPAANGNPPIPESYLTSVAQEIINGLPAS